MLIKFRTHPHHRTLSHFQQTRPKKNKLYIHLV